MAKVLHLALLALVCCAGLVKLQNAEEDFNEEEARLFQEVNDEDTNYEEARDFQDELASLLQEGEEEAREFDDANLSNDEEEARESADLFQDAEEEAREFQDEEDNEEEAREFQEELASLFQDAEEEARDFQDEQGNNEDYEDAREIQDELAREFQEEEEENNLRALRQQKVETFRAYYDAAKPKQEEAERQFIPEGQRGSTWRNVLRRSGFRRSTRPLRLGQVAIIPVISRRCATPGNHTVLSHCARYLACGVQQFQGVRRTCGMGELFDSDRKVCLPATTVDCRRS